MAKGGAWRGVATLLLLSLAAPGCESSTEDAAARRAQVEAATAMEPIPGAPAPSAIAREPTGPRLSVEALSELVFRIMSSPGALVPFTETMDNRKLGCAAGFDQMREIIRKSTIRVQNAIERIEALVPGYSRAELSRAFDLGTERSGVVLDRLNEMAPSLPKIADAYGKRCPEQARAIGPYAEEHRQFLHTQVDRLVATGMVSEADRLAAAAPGAATKAPAGVDEGERPPLQTFVDLLIEVSAEAATFEGLLEEVKNDSGDCDERLERVTGYLLEASKRSEARADRFLALLPRYSAAEQQRATRQALPHFQASLTRAQRAATGIPTLLGKFKRDCPRQAPLLQEAIRDHQRTLTTIKGRLEASGAMPR